MSSAELSPIQLRGAAPVRVALCITELDPGGAERSLVELVLRLDRKKFEAIIYCLGPRPSGNPTSLVDVLESAQVKVHCFGATRIWQLPILWGKLRRRMKLDRPLVVQTFLFHANVLGAVAAQMCGIRHVVSGIRVAERRAQWHVWLARWVDCCVGRYVCVSESVRRFSIESGRLGPEKICVIPNGVDYARFASASTLDKGRLGVAPSRRLIACIARLDTQKGVDWLLELMPRVFCRETACDLVVVGQGPQRARLERLSARLGIGARVHFAGYRTDVPEILAASDLIVLPSRWEGMSNVLLEAMAAGKPVVATNVEGVCEALGPAADAQCVTVGAPEAFADKVVALLGDPALSDRLGRENQLRAAGLFSLENMAEAFQRLYESLIARG